MDEQRHETSATAALHPPRRRSPLIIGGIAWMFVVVMLLIAWKLFA